MALAVSTRAAAEFLSVGPSEVSHKKRGQLTTSPEWAKHLRPLLQRFFWKGERRGELDLKRSAASFTPEPAAGIDPRNAVLIGTYATSSMAAIIADALRSEGCAVCLVISGREGPFPSLNLVSGAAGLFVAPESEAAAREIARTIEDPVQHC